MMCINFRVSGTIDLRCNVSKKELLKRIELLENEVAALKVKVAVLEAGKTSYPEPFTPQPFWEPYRITCGDEKRALIVGS